MKFSSISNRRRKTKYDSSGFTAACEDPFRPDALGARIPDEYAYPTTTFHHRSSITVTSDSIGNLGLVLLPCPYWSMLHCIGSFSWTSGSNYANNNWSSIPPASLTAECENFRLVSWGIRLRNLQAPGTATGMIEIAQVPCLNTIPSYTALFNAAITPAYGFPLIAGGYYGTGLPSLLGYPESDEVAVQELMSNDVLVVGKVTSPEWMVFKNPDTTASVNGTQTINEGGVITTSTGVVAAAGSRGGTDCVGRTCIMINGRGFPNITKAFDIEIIYHYEGTPITAATNYINTAAPPISVVNPRLTEVVVAKLSRSPVMRVIPPFIAHAKGVMSDAAKGGFDAINARLGLGPASVGPQSLSRSLGRKATEQLLLALAARYAGPAGAAATKAAITARKSRKRLKN